MLRFTSLVLAIVLVTTTAGAQPCNQGQRLAKNDRLPDVPSGQYAVAVIPGLCENEAAMEVLDVGAAVRVHKVSVGYGHKFGTNGVQALVDVEIYDGATVDAAGRYKLGSLVFKLSSGSSNLQIQSHGINELTLPRPVQCDSGRVVIGFRMLFNTASGTCQAGYDANFFTDNGPVCTPGKSVIDAIGHGPIDPATYRGFPLPLCPLFFRGNWAIRACIEPLVSVKWSGFATPGGSVSLNYLAPGQGGDAYFAMVAGATSPRIATPWGEIPLALDVLFQCFLADCRGLMSNGVGLFNQSGNAFGSLAIPNDQALSGLDLYVAFITFQLPNLVPFKSISSPSPVIPIR